MVPKFSSFKFLQHGMLTRVPPQMILYSATSLPSVSVKIRFGSEYEDLASDCCIHRITCIWTNQLWWIGIVRIIIWILFIVSGVPSRILGHRHKVSFEIISETNFDSSLSQVFHGQRSVKRGPCGRWSGRPWCYHPWTCRCTAHRNALSASTPP